MIGEVEHLDVLIVGAGLSGIGAAHHLTHECPWASFAVFEARDAIGGTWDLFRYPGIRSDSDMFTLGYRFRPWTGKNPIAQGGEILQYIRDTAAEDGTVDKIRFHHRIVRADWSTEDARWTVTAERADTGETVVVTAGFVFFCSGYYRYDHGHQPVWPGLEGYAGTLVHPQRWPEDLDVGGKRVVVIGSGATAVTLIPSLAELGAHVTMLQRSPTYIASLPTKNPVVAALRKVLPPKQAGEAIWWFYAMATLGSYNFSRRYPALMKRLLKLGVKAQLPKGYDVDTHFTPRYDPWDQRLCVVPGGDLFKAIKRGTAEVVTDHIERFTEGGVRLASGRELEADIVVSATGLEMLFIGGATLTVDGTAVEPGELLVYKGMMLEGIPNAAMAIGYTNASWTLKVGLTNDHVCRILNHLRAEGLRQVTPVNDDPSVTKAPVLSLTSGYVQRAAAQFPKSGSRFPWQVYQSFLRDYRALKLAGIEDPALRFDNPVPVVATTAATTRAKARAATAAR